ncbi:type I DNA topoisomerase [Candidatus Beckwithbacteria bacterium]|nr:type I DNA topoisomerase [Candidatus Beckwithbacteria bacterium]
MQLIIVESPTKARTLGRYLGDKYKVEASMGHVRDLPKSKIGVDTKNKYEPTYEISEGKEKVIKQLSAAAKKADHIIIATDPDREGEAIGYHVQWLLEKQAKVGKSKFVRATFHEITKDAILHALENTGSVNMALVDAQQARRVLDRLVGYKLSPVLWKKVRRGLSAGRVQSVAVKLIYEREKEIEAFKPEEYWEIGAKLKSQKIKGKAGEFIVDLYKISNKLAKVGNTKDAKKIVADLKKASYQIASVAKKELSQNPLPPFITSTLQRSAANLFGWSSRNTMRQAQQLYERGYITYHRTDSLSLSQQALAMAGDYIPKEFGDQYYTGPRGYKTTSKLAQEAHEAIRPTKVDRSLDLIEKKCGATGKKLYQMILNRFLASQMAPAKVSKTTVLVQAGKNYQLRAVGEIQIFDGWRKIYGKYIEGNLLPDLSEGEQADLMEVLSQQKFTQPPARYTESTLIKALEQRGIGRPSTYAPTISTILNRRYVEKLEKKFYPTSVGMAVTEFLVKNFDQVMDYDFTAKIEEELDEIAQGKRKWYPVVDEFYKPLSSKIKDVEKNAERVKIAVEKTGEKCPECKEGDLVIRVGRFGKFLSCSRFPDCKYTKNFVEKVEGMKCPDCGKGDIIVRRTKKGRQFYGCSAYPKCKWASWTKPKK